jgi:hydroxymethylpyrimidine pyrophosphatase-like HAD family hydrolase
MGKAGLIRAVATGRSLVSFLKDWRPEIELDYLIYSSGMALCRWTRRGPGEHIYTRAFPPEEQKKALETVLALKKGFLAFLAPPDSHCFYYQDAPDGLRSPGFQARLIQFQSVARPWQPVRGLDLEPLSQFLIMVRTHDLFELKEKFQSLNPQLSVTHSTSPYEDDCVWLEVFPAGVSKSTGSQALVDLLGLGSENTVALGNDFNDKTLLDWAGLSYIVPEAPPELLAKFLTLKGPGPILQKVFNALKSAGGN